MVKKEITVFSLFIIAAMIGCVFIYLYRQQVNELVTVYAASIIGCSNISDEQDCYKNASCEGIYGPSCPTCQDSEFKRCAKKPAQVLAAAAKEQGLCRQTGGQWYSNKLGSFCLCQKSPAGNFFDKDNGCVNK